MSEYTQLVDGCGRKINYLRISVTDRCNFRCVYCMNEDVTFLPRQRVLALEEIQAIAQVFAEMGVNKIRLTGGEPLVRKDVIKLVQGIGQMPQIKTLGITTNGSRLVNQAESLKAAGVNRLNVSLDTLDDERFSVITRTGRLHKVLQGIQAAKEAGFEHIKLNAVIMKGRNDDEIPALVDFVLEHKLDISFIEEMPLGAITEHDRVESFCSSDEVREVIRQRYELLPGTENSGGPSRYYRIPGTESRIGFISPHSHNFCDTCNRLRLTAEGRLLLCLGNENSVDLRGLIRRYPGDTERLKAVIQEAIKYKPRQHHFNQGEQILRFMNLTGG